MKNSLLFPRPFKIIGLLLVILFIILFIAWFHYGFEFSFLNIPGRVTENNFNFEDHNLTNEFIGAGLLTGLLFIAFAREQIEDERITLIRLQSLQISQYLSYVLFVLTLFLVDGLSFLLTMLYLPYVFLLIFIVVYYCRLYLFPKFASNEK